jgi:preprotein translocase subunit SecD
MIRQLITFIATFFLFYQIGCAQNTLICTLTKEKIDTVYYVESFDSTYTISINLREPFIEEFRVLTAENVGKMLTVKMNDTVVILAVIRSEIPNGNMVINNIPTLEMVNNYQKMFPE